MILDPCTPEKEKEENEKEKGEKVKEKKTKKPVPSNDHLQEASPS